MKKLITVFAASLLMLSFAFGADEVVPVAKAGAMTLDFSFSGLGSFGLGSPAIGGGLGIKYFLEKNLALRVGLQAEFKSETNPYNPPSNNLTQAGTDGSKSGNLIGFSADGILYMSAISPRVRPYLGAGLTFSTSSTEQKDAVANVANTFQTTVKNNQNGCLGYYAGTTFSVRGLAGVEFFLFNEISISTEYQLSFIESSSRKDEETSAGTVTVTKKIGSSSKILGFSAFGATLSLYF